MYVLVILGLMRNLDKKVCAQVDEDDENGVNGKKTGAVLCFGTLGSGLKGCAWCMEELTL